jgi:ABC-type transporter Mla MlaB component
VIEPESSGERHGAFLATAEGWRFEGTLTMDTAASVMASADALPLPDTGRVDLGGLVQGDSAALAEKRELRVENIPKALLSLAVAYGVDDITHGTA